MSLIEMGSTIQINLVFMQGYSWPITRWGLFQGKLHFSRDPISFH